MELTKSIFFDIQLGASGDMLLGALLDLGLDFEKLKNELKKLNLDNWEISLEKKIKYNVTGTYANVICKPEHVHKTLNDIKAIIAKSNFSQFVKNNVIAIFEHLARVEAKIHGNEIDKIHFHEVGALDSIVDITAFCVSIEMLKVKNIFFNEFNLGTGTTITAHGEIPVPVPAVVELIKNFNTVFTNKKGELITPTAAAMLTALGKQQTMPISLKIIKCGIGFGSKNFVFPSYTRAMEIDIQQGSNDEATQMECNIDDMNPQIYPFVSDKLLQAGALDVYTSNVYMKKGRQGTLLTVIANKKNIDQLKEIIYLNTTTLGLRISDVCREKLERKFEKVKIFDNEISIKIGYYNNKIVNIQPEYEECKKLALEKGIPLKDILAGAINEFLTINRRA